MYNIGKINYNVKVKTSAKCCLIAAFSYSAILSLGNNNKVIIFHSMKKTFTLTIFMTRVSDKLRIYRSDLIAGLIT